MPTYDYQCPSCGEQFESLESTDADRISCKLCGAEGATRTITGFGIVSRQMTRGQQRRNEDKRGTGRDGARERFQRNLDRARAQAPPLPGAAKKKPPA